MTPEMKITACICAFCLLFAAAFPAGGQSGHIGYVCPPCDSDCHDMVYDARGACPVCGKSLIPKPGAVPNATLANPAQYNDISPAAVCEALEQGKDVVFLDVRTEGEFQGTVRPMGRLKDAVNLPLQELEARIGELEQYKTRGMIVVYCARSVRSPRASALLHKNGLRNIYNLLGGMTAWNEAAAADVPCKDSLLVR